MSEINYSKFEWKRTSRNTEISIFQDSHFGRVLLKRSSLLNASSMKKQIVAYESLRRIASNMKGITSPETYPNLSKDNIIAIEYFAGPSFHELWRSKGYRNYNINGDIDYMFSILSIFHMSSLEYSDGEPFAYCDFGPKNVLKISDSLSALIDPPDDFIPKKPNFDFGILIFEIERSLLQNSRFSLVLKVRKSAKLWIESSGNESFYSDFNVGYRFHIFDIFKRYFFFHKKRNPFIEFLRGLILIPLIFFYMVFMELYENYLNYKISLNSKNNGISK